MNIKSSNLRDYFEQDLDLKPTQQNSLALTASNLKQLSKPQTDRSSGQLPQIRLKKQYKNEDESNLQNQSQRLLHRRVWLKSKKEISHQDLRDKNSIIQSGTGVSQILQVRYDDSGSPINRSIMGSQDNYSNVYLYKETRRKMSLNMIELMKKNAHEIKMEKEFGIRRKKKPQQVKLAQMQQSNQMIKNIISMPQIVNKIDTQRQKKNLQFYSSHRYQNNFTAKENNDFSTIEPSGVLIQNSNLLGLERNVEPMIVNSSQTLDVTNQERSVDNLKIPKSRNPINTGLGKKNAISAHNRVNFNSMNVGVNQSQDSEITFSYYEKDDSQ